MLCAPSSLARSILNSEACTIYAALSAQGHNFINLSFHTFRKTSAFKTMLVNKKTPGSGKRLVRWSSTTSQGHVQIRACTTGLILTQRHRSPSSVHFDHNTSKWRGKNYMAISHNKIWMKQANNLILTKHLCACHWTHRKLELLQGGEALWGERAYS